MYYSPGVDYLCPRCESSSVRFVFDEKCRGWFEAMMLMPEIRKTFRKSIVAGIVST